MCSKKEQIMTAIDKLDPYDLECFHIFAEYLSSDDPVIAERRESINNVFDNFRDVPVSILAQIHKNWKLFKMGFVSTSRIFINLDQSILMKDQDDILLHFGEINIYAVMSVPQYTKFKSFAKENQIYQIILLSENQKVILLCDKDPDFVTELILATKNHTKYELQVRSAENQLEIKNKIVANYNESKNIYDDLARALFRRYKDIGKILKLVEPEQQLGSLHKILKLPLPPHSGRDMSELGTMVIVYGNNNGTINVTMNAAPKKKNKTAITKSQTAGWIERNKPITAIPRREYYDRYIAEWNISAKPYNMVHFGRMLSKTLGSNRLSSPSIDGELCYLYQE